MELGLWVCISGCEPVTSLSSNKSLKRATVVFLYSLNVTRPQIWKGTNFLSECTVPLSERAQTSPKEAHTPFSNDNLTLPLACGVEDSKCRSHPPMLWPHTWRPIGAPRREQLDSTKTPVYFIGIYIRKQNVRKKKVPDAHLLLPTLPTYPTCARAKQEKTDEKTDL
jgi:hypothetical protein